MASTLTCIRPAPLNTDQLPSCGVDDFKIRPLGGVWDGRFQNAGVFVATRLKLLAKILESVAPIPGNCAGFQGGRQESQCASGRHRAPRTKGAFRSAQCTLRGARRRYLEACRKTRVPGEGRDPALNRKPRAARQKSFERFARLSGGTGSRPPPGTRMQEHTLPDADRASLPESSPCARSRHDGRR